jgi:hypothetical protein
MLIAIFILLILILIGVTILMADFSVLNANVAQLSADVDKLVATQPADPQPQIDAAAQAVADVDAKVVAATPK